MSRCACGGALGRIAFVTSEGRQLCPSCGRRRLTYLRRELAMYTPAGFKATR